MVELIGGDGGMIIGRVISNFSAKFRSHSQSSN